MNKILFILAAIVLVNCQENATIETNFTGNEVTYPLFAGSQYNVDGTVTFKELKDGSALVFVLLSGTEGNVRHPVHLHLGDISTSAADILALLNPVEAKSGASETVLKTFADETLVTYRELVKLNASVKVHLAASGAERDIILAGGNIGANASRDFSGGRLKVEVCKSE